MRPHSLVRADLITAIILVCFGLGVVEEAWRMPRLAERQINPLTVPGLVPGLLGAVLAIMGAILLVRSVYAGRHRPAPAHPDAAATGPVSGDSWGRALLTGLMCFAYAAGLVGHVDFRAATALFVFAFVVVFEWAPGDTPSLRARKVGLAAVLAVLVAVAVALVFQELFLVRLP